MQLVQRYTLCGVGYIPRALHSGLGSQVGLQVGYAPASKLPAWLPAWLRLKSQAVAAFIPSSHADRPNCRCFLPASASPSSGREFLMFWVDASIISKSVRREPSTPGSFWALHDAGPPTRSILYLMVSCPALLNALSIGLFLLGGGGRR